MLYDAVGHVELGSLARPHDPFTVNLRDIATAAKVACDERQGWRSGGVEGWRGETGGDSAGVEVACDERVQQCGGGGRKSA